MNAFETEYQDEITCPYCGYVHGDSQEVLVADPDLGDGDEIEFDCEGCDASFFVMVNIDITYSAAKASHWRPLKANT